jgi:hypothetical protein
VALRGFAGSATNRGSTASRPMPYQRPARVSDSSRRSARLDGGRAAAPDFGGGLRLAKAPSVFPTPHSTDFRAPTGENRIVAVAAPHPRRALPAPFARSVERKETGTSLWTAIDGDLRSLSAPMNPGGITVADIANHRSLSEGSAWALLRQQTNATLRVGNRNASPFLAFSLGDAGGSTHSNLHLPSLAVPTRAGTQ